MKRGDIDPWWSAMHPEIGIFRDYLESMESFIETESRKHLESIETITRNIELTNFSPVANADETFSETDYDYYRLDAMYQFANILRKSFFVGLYTFLEATLMRECRRREEHQNASSLSLSDIAGKGISKAMTYLIKVQRLNFSLETSSEWSEITNYGRLRNCIVHNEGRLDETVGQCRQLEAYISRKADLSLSGIAKDEVVLERDFCKEAVDLIERFLYILDNAS